MKTRTSNHRAKLLFGLLAVSLLSACEYTVQIDFIIENQTGDNISVIRTFSDSTVIDSNNITHLTKLRVLDYVNPAYSPTGKYMDGLGKIPWIDSLGIIDANGNYYKGNALLLDKWVELYPDKRTGRGAFILSVTADDFD